MITRFTGELMTCCMCGKEQQSDPHVESNWTFVEVDGCGAYACPTHIPAPGASKRAYTKAYEHILRKVIELCEGKKNV